MDDLPRRFLASSPVKTPVSAIRAAGAEKVGGWPLRASVCLNSVKNLKSEIAQPA